MLVESCANPERGERVLGLVKDGTVYEAFRSASGDLVVVDTQKDRLPITLDTVDGVAVARVECGENCYIFDPKMFRVAIRDVLDLARKGGRGLILDLSRVSLIEAPHLNALSHLHDHLVGRGRDLVIVTGSAVVAREIRKTLPNGSVEIFGKEPDAIAHVQQPRVGEAAG